VAAYDLQSVAFPILIESQNTALARCGRAIPAGHRLFQVGDRDFKFSVIRSVTSVSATARTSLRFVGDQSTPNSCHGRTTWITRGTPRPHRQAQPFFGVAPYGIFGCAARRYAPTIETKLTQRPGAPPRLWVSPSFGF
jgi:hypothetical protein